MKVNKSIGALWKRKAQSGRPYLSGLVELDGQKHRIVVFSNTYKEENGNQPDYRILRQTQKTDEFE